MSPLVAAVVSMALPVPVLWLACGAVFVGTGASLALTFWGRLFVPSMVCVIALVSLGLYHLMVQP